MTHNNFIKPLYDNYCFSNIPGTIKELLGVPSKKTLPTDTLPKNRTDKVVFLFIDSFGWEFWEKYHSKYPFLNRFLTDGTVTQLTSQFPSTTAAHVTTIHTGKNVGESGIYEWFYYEPKVDAIIAPLLYSFAGDKERDTLKIASINPRELFPTQTFYQELANANIASYIFQSKDYTPSTYSDVVFAGATKIVPCHSLAHGLSELTQTIKNTKGPAYYYFYYGLIDTVGHIYGPDSAAHQAEIHNTFSMLEDILYQGIKGIQDLTILLSADHGMTSIDPKTTIYLNKVWPEITQVIKVNQQGKLLVPAGSPRDMFLHLQDKSLISTKTKLEKLLNGKAEVRLTSDLLKEGYFAVPSPELLARLGNLVILPFEGQSVWWYEEGKFEQKYYGHHGGLTEKEMQIPFLALQT